MSLDTFEEIQAAFDEAEERRRRGEYAAALDDYVGILTVRLGQILSGGRLSELTAADLTIIERAADLAALLSLPDAADDLLGAMVTQLEGVGNYVGADYAALKRIHLWLGCGRLDAACRLLRAMKVRIGEIDNIVFEPAALARWESERNWPGANADDCAVLFSRLYHVMGWLLAGLGQYASALCAFRQGLKHAENYAHPLARSVAMPLKVAVAGALLEKGEMEEALGELDRLMPQLDEHADPGVYVRWLELKGKHSMLCGNYGDAHGRYKSILVVCHLHRFERQALTAALNLAHVLILLNHTGIARELLQVTAQRAEQLGEASARHHSYFLLRLAAARSLSLFEGDQLSSRDEPRPQTTAATNGRQEGLPPSDPRDIEQSANNLSFFEDRALAFQWSLGLDDVKQAAQIYSDMKQTFAATDSALIKLRLRVMGGILSYFTGDLISAERRLGECRAELRESGLVPELWQAQRVLGWCWAKLRFADERRRELERENAELLKRMAESLPPEHRAVYMLNKWTADEEYIAGELDQLRALKETAATGARLKRPLRRWEMMKRLYALLKHIDRYKDALARQERVGDGSGEDDTTFWRRLWAHPRKRATFSFLVLPDCLLIVRMWWLHLDFEVRKISRIDVRELVGDWHKLVRRKRGQWQRDNSAEETATAEAEADYLASVVGLGRDFFLPAEAAESTDSAAEILRKMSETLALSPLLNALPRRVGALTIVPDDSLHGFPFAALIHGGKFLIERYALSFAFESGVPRAPARRRESRHGLLVGVSRGGVTVDGKKFSPLPGVSEEVKHLQRWLSSERTLPTSLLKDGEATREAVLEQLPGATFVHMACHGIFEPDKPDASGLVLVPTTGRAEILSLRELSALDLTGLRHIGLSFCWSADNFILPGRWIISLPETIWRAGAQSVLGHLWKVDDNLAVAFTRRFYKDALTCDLDEAVRRTQLKCLSGELLHKEHATGTSSPIHWAGYNLYGDPRRLRLR